jgi:hypothetical protein
MNDQPAEIIPPEGGKADRKQDQALRRWFGRPTAAQNRLLESLLAALVVDFEENGPKAIEKLRAGDPLNYLRLIAVMVRKTQSDISAGRRFTDDDVCDALTKLRELAAASRLGGGLVPEHPLGVGRLHEGPEESLSTAGLPALRQAD